MKALILAAGYATRLYPLTKDYPKPLLTVKGRHIIDYIVDRLEGIQEIDEIIVVTNSKFIRRFKEWRNSQDAKKRISLVDDLTKSEKDKRGAIGDIDFAINKIKIKDDLLVIGGDNLFNGDLRKFFSSVRRHKVHPAIGVYDIKDKARASHYGIVRLDAQKKIIDFKEKPRHPRSTLVAMCLYYFPREKLGLIKDYLSDKSAKQDATGFYIDWLREKTAVYGFVFSRNWYDIGHHQNYNEAKSNF